MEKSIANANKVFKINKFLIGIWIVSIFFYAISLIAMIIREDIELFWLVMVLNYGFFALLSIFSLVFGIGGLIRVFKLKNFPGIEQDILIKRLSVVSIFQFVFVVIYLVYLFSSYYFIR